MQHWDLTQTMTDFLFFMACSFCFVAASVGWRRGFVDY
jgi:hypothetical protein